MGAPKRKHPEALENSRREKLEWISVERLQTLKRNPQYLTPTQMEALKASIERDGFVAPILVRPLQGGRFRLGTPTGYARWQRPAEGRR